MSLLRGLRTNCILAPLVVAVLGAAAIVLTWSWQRGILAQAAAAGESESPGRSDSAETAALRSTVLMVLEQQRAGGTDGAAQG